MQYVLTEEEYQKLLNDRKHEITLSKDKLQKLCTKIAETMPAGIEWLHPNGVKQSWGCILTTKTWYCDECPVKEICPNKHKKWSQ